jgi:hypothetical protein
VVVFGVAIAAAGGCGHRGETPPEALRAFASAMARGDWDRAYGRMSEGYRRRISRERFRAEAEADRRAVLADAAALGVAPGSRPARAMVETSGGAELPLVLEGGQWRLDEQPVAPYSQASPRAALRTLVRAIGERRYDVVLRLVPARHRPRVTQESLRVYWEGPSAEAHRKLLELLRANVNGAVVETGTEARMPIGRPGEAGGEREVLFVLEDGVWKVEDAR